MKILHRYTAAVLFEDDGETIKDTLIAAVKAEANLREAYLSEANLRGANLSEANLRGANLYRADLREANLSEANLSGADLREANLSGADLREANLSEAHLREADLREANLSEANLSGADLSEADLREAYLSEADLREAYLRGANLYRADLREADLYRADLDRAYSERCIVAEGDLVGWKKLSNGTVCKLKIPESARRVGGLTGRKCRAEFAVVLEGGGTSSHDGKTVYKPGETVKPDRYDPNPLIECAPGIHFFITKAEAERY